MRECNAARIGGRRQQLIGSAALAEDARPRQSSCHSCMLLPHSQPLRNSSTDAVFNAIAASSTQRHVHIGWTTSSAHAFARACPCGTQGAFMCGTRIENKTPRGDGSTEGAIRRRARRKTNEMQSCDRPKRSCPLLRAQLTVRPPCRRWLVLAQRIAAGQIAHRGQASIVAGLQKRRSRRPPSPPGPSPSRSPTCSSPPPHSCGRRGGIAPRAMRCYGSSHPRCVRSAPPRGIAWIRTKSIARSSCGCCSTPDHFTVQLGVTKADPSLATST
jgi:hypothetical protein